MDVRCPICNRLLATLEVRGNGGLILSIKCTKCRNITIKKITIVKKDAQSGTNTL